MPSERWSQRAVAIADASSEAALLVRAKDVVAVEPSSGMLLGARFADARTPWPFLRGDEVWRIQRSGLVITDLRGKRTRTVPLPTVAGAKPISLSGSPHTAFGAHSHDRLLCAVDVRGTQQIIARALSDEALLWQATIVTKGKVRGLWALDSCAAVLVDEGKREAFVCLDPDGSETGRVNVPKQSGVRRVLEWGDELILTSEDGTSHERLDVAEARRHALSIPAESVVHVIGGEAYALHGQTLERLGPKRKRVVVFPPSDFPQALFSPIFAVRDRLGLIRSIGPERVQVQWVRRKELTLATTSKDLSTKTRIGTGKAAGSILLLSDGRSVSALQA